MGDGKGGELGRGERQGTGGEGAVNG